MEPIKAPRRPDGLNVVRNLVLKHDFDVQAMADGNTTEISIYDEIGFFGVSAERVRRALDEIETENIHLRINSPGGDVFDGIAIYNDLLAHPANVRVSVTGLAASAASLIAMAGDTIEIADSAFIMIHNAWAITAGDSSEMLNMAEVLGTIDGALVRVYDRRTDIGVDEIAAMMAKETWLDSGDAVERGFADAVAEADGAKALFDVSVFKNAPFALKRKVEASLRDEGYSHSEARRMASAGFKTSGLRDEGRSPALRDGDASEIAAALRGMVA